MALARNIGPTAMARISSNCRRPRPLRGASGMAMAGFMTTLPCVVYSEIDEQTDQRGGQGEPLHCVAQMLARAHGHDRPVDAVAGRPRLQARLEGQAATPELLPQAFGLDLGDQSRPAFGR